MKKLLTAFSILIACHVNAQIVNNSFESWSLDTFYLGNGVVFGLPADTSVFTDPDNWTSSNVASDLDSLGNVILVTKSNNAYAGQWAIRMKTDSIAFHTSGTVFNLTLPGFAVSGKFPIDPVSLILNSGATISPITLKGAGQPFTQRLAKIKGYYNYQPVYNAHTGANDTCIVWALLRKGSEIVANAIFKSTDSTTGYQPFEATFKYASCSIPDTLVILMASSVPNIHDITGGGGLIKGSVLLVDTLSYDTLDINYNFAPIAKDDLDTTLKNTPVTIHVLANDADCDSLPLTVTVISGPANGQASLLNNDIIYTPNTDFVGMDTILYRLSDSNASDSAYARIKVVNNTGISEANEIPMLIYPVPTSNELNIRFENPGRSFIRVYDMIGNLVLSTGLTNNNNSKLPVGNLAGGLYSLQIVDERNVVIARGKFTVTK